MRRKSFFYYYHYYYLASHRIEPLVETAEEYRTVLYCTHRFYNIPSRLIVNVSDLTYHASAEDIFFSKRARRRKGRPSTVQANPDYCTIPHSAPTSIRIK